MPRIALDLDDVLVNHTTQFILFHNKTYGTRLRFHHFRMYDISRVLRVSPQEAYKRLNQFYESQEFDQMRPFSEALEYVRKFSQDGEELILITGRPKVLREKTRSWVKKYFPEIGQVLITGELLSGPEQLKGPICRRRNIDLIVEDSLEQAISCSQCAGVALFNKPWNENSPFALPKEAITRVDSWEEVYLLSKRY